MSHTRVFAPLPEEELRNLCMDMTRERYKKGFILCRQDETSLKKVYIIENGSLEIYFDERDNKRLRGTLARGDVFGGIAILMNSGKSARTVMVQEDATLLAIPKDNFIDICTRYESFYTFFVETFQDRMLDKSYAAVFQSSQVSHFLSGIVPFSFLTEDVLKEISREFSVVHYSSGTRLFYQVEARSSIYTSFRKAPSNAILRKVTTRRYAGSWEKAIFTAAFPCWSTTASLSALSIFLKTPIFTSFPKLFF